MRMGDCNVAEQEQDFIDSRRAWAEVFDGIAMLKNRLQGKSVWPLTIEEYAGLHATIFNMLYHFRVRGITATFDVSGQLYERYKEAFVEYINSLVLPVLRQKPDEFMLRELVNGWNNYKKMDHYMSRLFAPLDQRYTIKQGFTSVCDVGLICFRNLMYKELETTVRHAVISLFGREHKGEQIDHALRKNVLAIFVEIGMGNKDCYGNDFESAMLEDTAACCFWEAVSLILKDCPDYMQKAEECWRQERERHSHYLRADSKQKLVRLEQQFLKLLSQYASAKEQLGCHPLLQDWKHVTDEGTTVVKQAEDAASNKKSEKRDIVGPPEQVLPVLRQTHDEFMLRELVNRWENNHKIMVCWLSGFFIYFDCYFTSRCSRPVLHDVGLICFRHLVYQELKTTVRDAVISLIDREREGEQIDRALLKNVLGIFVEIGMGNMDCYENDFESAMLEDTAAYYSLKAASWILEDSCPDYMQKAEECLKQEKERVSHYLHADSEQKLLGRVEHELLSQYENRLLEKEHSGCHSLLQDGKMDDLSRMYRLFCRIPKGLEPIAHFFKQHVTDEGTTLVKQAEDAASNKKSEKRDIVGPLEQTFVWEVIELHDKYLQYVSTCFVNHSLFHKALKEAFEVFCNKGVAGSTSAELLATFCDNILKKGSIEKFCDEDIEETLEKVVKLLAFIGDKDLYSEFYRKKLARRLIFDKSANDEHERSILTKLKQKFGGQVTSKMEGMFTDLTLARENQPKFQKYLDDNAHAHPGIDLTVTVLTTQFWSSYKSFDLNLPAEMVKCVEVFKEFYETQTKHRKLTWIYSLGTCHLSGNFNARSVELIVTTHQGASLLLFNNAERLSYSEIKSQLNLSDEDIITLLHSLACSKYKILIKEPNTKSVTQSDYFAFNANFTDKSRKIKIPLPPVDEEKKKIIEDVDKDRRYAIDACIVRIMKSRKVLAHAQLVTECVEQLGRMFKPDFKAITKRIEDLITREYLERDKNNLNMLRYLA